jgi:hypothetical protein
MTTELDSTITNLHLTLEDLATAVLNLVEASRQQLREKRWDPEPGEQVK